MRKCFMNIMKYLTLETQSLLSSFVIFFTMSFGVFYPTSVGAGYSLEQLRIANTLINEAGGLGKTGLTYVAEVIRNQYNEQHVKYKNDKITYSDIRSIAYHPFRHHMKKPILVKIEARISVLELCEHSFLVKTLVVTGECCI